MDRLALEYLKTWKQRAARRPLIVRGARQVGKSYLVRELGRSSFDSFVTIDFERTPDAADVFASRDPRRILELLELMSGQRIYPGRTLLFLDEVQSAPAALKALRYFHEELPELHVIAAGSLLDIVLPSEPLPFPVGRVEYLHLGPMHFEEYLAAAGQGTLLEFLRTLPPGGAVPQPVHEQLRQHLRRFTAVGGMPEALRAWLESGSLRESDIVKQSLLSTYEDDFAKYGTRVDLARLRKVYRSLPRLVGKRFKYTLVDRDDRARDLAPALDLLCRARVAARVRRTAANGPPLAAEEDERAFKLLFLDVGLLLRALGLSLLDLEAARDLLLVNEGAVAEQLVGQHLLYGGEPFEEPALHFWARDDRSAAAEIDYVLAMGPTVLPIEVKAGKTGSLRSLHVFLREKARAFAVRLNSDPPSLLDTTATLPTGDRVAFRLLSLPLYLVGQVRRLVRAALAPPIDPI